MAKKSKKADWKQFKDFDGFFEAIQQAARRREDDDDGEEQSGEGGGEKGSEGTGLKDFVVDEKINAFASSYCPCDEFDDGAVGFDDSRLRTLLKAYVCPYGDPLKLYMEMLKIHGFRMVVSEATGELTMFVVRKYEY